MRGDLLELLQRTELRNYVTEESLGREVLQSAIEALSDGEFDHEAIGDAMASLFDAYLHHQRTEEVDPGGEFARLKQSAP